MKKHIILRCSSFNRDSLLYLSSLVNIPEIKISNKDISLEKASKKDSSLQNIKLRDQITTKSSQLFSKMDSNLEMVLNTKTILEFQEGIRNNYYPFYERHLNVPEILFLGKSNSGKSSLINSLMGRNIAVPSKQPGKTQSLEFYLLKSQMVKTKEQTSKRTISRDLNRKIFKFAFFIDSPGFGYVDAPLDIKHKMRELLYGYLKYSVRLKMIIYLINSKTGLTKHDLYELKKLENVVNSEIAIVFSKVESYNKDLNQNLQECRLFLNSIKNSRKEIFLTSSKTHYGIENMRKFLFQELVIK